MKVKKSISLLTASFMLASVIMTSFFSTIVSADYLPKNSEKSNGASNIVIMNTGYDNRVNTNGTKRGEYGKDHFLPYVGYLNQDGVAEDAFFDTFLLLTKTSPYKGSLTRYYPWAAGSKPGTWQDWKWSIDRLFKKGLQLDGLDSAVEQVGKDLHEPNKKVNVYVTLPFPDPQSKDFGDFNGDGTVKNLENLNTRKELIRWYIDTLTARFEQQQYKHLKLSGFYWLQEDLDTTVPGEQESADFASQYLQQRGLRLGWLPWYGAGEKANGNRLGFDFSALQPNHYGDDSTTIERVEEIADLAYANEAGVKVELDQRIVDAPRYRQTFYNYLITGVKKQFMNQSLLAYYQDVYAIYDLYHSEIPAAKQMYTDLYRFATGKLIPPQGNFAGRVVDRQGNGIAGATLTDKAGNAVTTDTDGQFAMNGLYATENSFVVEKQGLPSKSIGVNIHDKQTIYRDIMLENSGEPTVTESRSLVDFESDIKSGTNNGDYVKRTTVTDATYVLQGEKSLKIDFKAYPNSWIAAYIDSDYDGFEKEHPEESYPAYDLKDWSGYDAVSYAVFNASSKPQEIREVFMYEYDWGKTFARNIMFPPGQWTIITKSIQELKQAGINTENIIRFALMRNRQSEDATFYLDDLKLLKYETNRPAPDYRIMLPSKLATMDVGTLWSPVVIDKNDAQQKKVNAVFASSDSSIVEVTSDGKLHAIKPGTVVIRAQVGPVEVESVVIEVAPWAYNQIMGNETPLSINHGFQNPVLHDPLQGGTQYVMKNGSNLKIAHKYNDGNDMWIVFDHAGANKLYGMKEWRLSPNVDKDADPDLTRPSIMLWPDISDWIGPYIVGANDNGNGKGQDFTGGNHNYDGGKSSSTTGRTVKYNVWVDGKQLQDGTAIAGTKVKIEVVNRIQGFNTKEQDGRGREILQETVMYEIEGGKVQVHTEIMPLEEITLYRYYGLQSVNGAWNQEVRYYAGETEVGRSGSGVYSDSGTKAQHPDVDKYWLSSGVQDGSQHQLLVTLNRNYGLGKLQYLADDQPIVFTQKYGKSYFLQVFNKSVVLEQGEKVGWQGTYQFFSTPAQERTIGLLSQYANGYAVPTEDAIYHWEVIGDAVEKISESSNSVTMKGVKPGMAEVNVTMTYNGKSETFRSTVQVGDSGIVDTTELQRLYEEVSLLLQHTGSEFVQAKWQLGEKTIEVMRWLKSEGYTRANVDEAVRELKDEIAIFKKSTQI
ncbi:DUF4855 domain-containing protein [Paenibacillus popilliae]|uniref:DUF4855 domain-containing protein n=1 Tax=Paenibacillus popilliae TaxID=78057 RepID=A0ABY3AVU2_PAEPP|nr:DUF4855 domain-containing protein [Paenibacillus sp. SDF0028]TQR46630.1 DUF4855 domain-containing protein [Paenibacillus sp. SDF0028]